MHRMDRITIYDAHGNLVATVVVGAGSIRRFEVMKEDSVTVRFSMGSAVHFGIGCYADLPDEGGRFYAKNAQAPTYNTATGGYDYELRLDADYWLWENKLFMYTPEDGGREASFSLTASLDVHLGVLLRNLKARGYKHGGKDYTYTIDGSVSTAAKPITYSNMSIIDALNAMAEAWECEWWVVDGCVHFGRMENDTQPVDFKVGVNVESMERSDSKSEYATRIFVFGGERNIPSRYRKKLEFVVTDVGEYGGAATIEDTSRGIAPAMFADGDVTGNGPYESTTASAVHGISTPADNGYKVSSMFQEETEDGYVQDKSFHAGEYVLEMVNGADVSWGVKGIPMDAGSFRMVWDVIAVTDASETTLWSGETLVFPDTVSSAMPTPPALTLHLSEGAKLNVCVYGHFEANSGSLSGYDIQGTINFRGIHFKATGSYPSARAEVNFVTGVLAGNSYDSVLNPSHTADGDGVIVLPLGITPSVGDKYTIGNIVATEVPAEYFTEDTDADLVVGGVVQRRLMLPLDWNGGKNFIDAEEGMADAEIVELVVINESIYPRFTTEDADGNKLDGSPVTGVTTREDIIDDKESGGRVNVTYWALQDSALEFSEQYRIEGEDLQVTFSSGLLNGMTFKVDFIKDGTEKYGKAGQWFEIVRSDDYGRYLPDSALYPKAGDHYVLTGWDSSHIAGTGLVAQAEEELLEWGKGYIKKLNIDPSTYNCAMMSDYAYGKDEYGNLNETNAYKRTLLPGDHVRLFSRAFFKTGSRLSRVIGYERCLDIDYDTPRYIVGETAAYSRLGELSDKIDNIVLNGQTYGGVVNGGNGGVYVIRVNDTTPASDRNVFSALRSLGMFLRKDTADSASGVITFLSGLLLGDGSHGIDGGGNASLASVKAAVAELAEAAIAKVTSEVSFGRVATFLAGALTEMLESPDFVEGLAGFGLHKTEAGRYRLEVDELLVRVKAIFNELEIRKLSYAGGSVDFSAAGSTIVRVRPLVREGEAEPYAWRCFFMKDDGTTRTRNWWHAGDMAKCQTFNLDGAASPTARLLSLGGRLIAANAAGSPLGYGAARQGNAGNRYYWRLVTATGSETLDDGREYDYADLSNEKEVVLTDTEGVEVRCQGYDEVFDGFDESDSGMKWHADANDAPQAGDEIVQQGSQTDPERQHLIRITVVGENAPALEEYVGIGRHDGKGVYNLSARRVTAIAPRTGNVFRARRFEVETEGGAVTRLPVYRGEWQPGVTYYYYEQVRYGGGLWLCVSQSGTQAEPADGSAAWQRQVDPGKDGTDGNDGAPGTPGKDGTDGALSAVRAYFTPASLVVSDNGDGFDLSDAELILTVMRGFQEEITGSCTVSYFGTGCTVEQGDYPHQCRITGIVGKPERAQVRASIRVPAQYAGGSPDTMECHADVAVNYPGQFRETIENDVKTQVAQRTFTYIDEDGQLRTVEGISELVQSSEGLRSEVWRRQPAGSVIANGTFASGLDSWAVSGGVEAAVEQGVPCARLAGEGAQSLEQRASQMLCDWGAVMGGSADMQARLSLRVLTATGCTVRASLLSNVDGELDSWGQAFAAGGGWQEASAVLAFSNVPTSLAIEVTAEGSLSTSMECCLADVQLVPDIDTVLGSRIQQTAEGVEVQVGDLSGRVSTVEQTASSISLRVSGVEQGLEDTGIDIEQGVVRAAADKFLIVNNSGRQTFSVDADGNIVGSGGAAFKGDLSAAGGTFSGMLAKKAVSVTDANIGDYTTTDELGQRRFDFARLGGYVVFSGSAGAYIYLPDTTNGNYVGELRSLVGNKLLVYNTGSGAVTFDNAYHSPDNPMGTSVMMGQFALLECVADVKDGREFIYWAIKVGNTVGSGRQAG